MYAKCLDSGIRARKEDVRIILAELDPVNSQARRRRRLNRRQYFSQGPNFIWHIDSYDKLKPYGICINGCIDGYSHKIVWLKSAYTSSDPRVIGSYFVGVMQELGGGPRLVRTDMGTENVVVRDIQRDLRSDGEDIWAGENSFIAGPGNNIEIEFIETSDFARRPQAHTCGCLLKLPQEYQNYPDLRSDFNAILKSSVRVMDII
ncbi:hypothetical protein DPEC_G00188560 [Dallia pectoralis]|uniref:Uncharacterized protein n=1 Tax=Dallia pectoralis TaxID=75939 RepID=A0ACC2GCB5_DALPE|nr:hypothetical protein DPEC_G00188560 [Dallia pectoralis]